MIELEKEIEANPERAEPYLVLADVLQAEGDPRGRLILLQHHLREHPDDQPAREDAARLLGEHGAALLGGLADMVEAELSWGLGFLRTLRLEASSTERLLELLPTALASPSLRFLQTLELRVAESLTPTGKSDAYGRVAARLLELGQGQLRALRQLQLGDPGDYALSPALRAAFRGLNTERDAGETLTELRDGLAQCKRLKVKLEPAAALALQPVDASLEIDLDARQLLLGLKGELDKGKPISFVGGMLRLYTAESLDRFGAELIAQFEARGSSYADLWVLEAAAALGGDHTATRLAELLRGDELSYERFLRTVELLAKIGTPLAIDELYHFRLETGDDQREQHVRATLERCARGLHRPLQRILDQLSLADYPGALRERLARRFGRRLEDLMISGHRLRARDFRRGVVEEPARRASARRVLWATYDGDRIERSFRLADDGALLDREGDPIQLAAEARVGVVHPAELDSETLASWSATFAAEPAQPFQQLERPVYRLLPRESEHEAIERFHDHFVDSYAALNALHERGWYLGKHFERQRVTASFEAPRAVFRIDDEVLRPADVHPVILSEVLWDLETALRAPPRELRCAHCGEPIAPDTPRVGAYHADPQRGTSTAWVHVGCHREWASLASPEALDAELFD